MLHQADFLFHGALNDFLPQTSRHTLLRYTFRDAPAVKDAIEAIGVPHPEVEVALVNDVPVTLLHPLRPHDQVALFPAGPEYTWPAGYALKARTPPEIKFVLDVHLGKLARLLRMLGFDTCYENHYADKTIARIAEQDNRMVLTRDVGLLKQKIIEWGHWLRSQQPGEQLAEVIHYYELAGKFRPFERCMACNGKITQVSKAAILDKLPPKTKMYFNEFFQCLCCKRIYWKGSHYERMQQFVVQLQQQ
ncbi:hypothetical protein I2I11_14920 [Pontibacter sp. 172403-2]|uniref:Mut7-C RNAse domain-containing protein n=1 Tax=Pontibacter rufus TaxID=2791028 RepID=UPI0018AFA4C6|nr:Mut7-C RNAse domain-containing protein [Pontibacter sp. 172403-2]MBF9254595.1 hypothetical protein [Pontibacter sp. 172403-2]